MSATPRKTRTAAKKSPTGRRTVGVREQAAQTTRDNILKAAIKVFARYGYDGGSVEKISKAAKSFDRMIYYYFGSKEGLYIEVIEEIYRRMNEAEEQLNLRPDQPLEALQAVVGYYLRHSVFVTPVNTENLHKGRHIVKSVRAREYSSPAIEIIRQLLASGQAQGLFRLDISARDLYLLIAANGYFYMSNRHTLSAFLGEDLEAPEALAHWEEFVIDTVLRAVAPAAPPTSPPAPTS